MAAVASDGHLESMRGPLANALNAVTESPDRLFPYCRCGQSSFIQTCKRIRNSKHPSPSPSKQHVGGRAAPGPGLPPDDDNGADCDQGPAELSERLLHGVRVPPRSRCVDLILFAKPTCVLSCDLGLRLVHNSFVRSFCPAAGLRYPEPLADLSERATGRPLPFVIDPARVASERMAYAFYYRLISNMYAYAYKYGDVLLSSDGPAASGAGAGAGAKIEMPPPLLPAGGWR